MLRNVTECRTKHIAKSKYLGALEDSGGFLGILLNFQLFRCIHWAFLVEHRKKGVISTHQVCVNQDIKMGPICIVFVLADQSFIHIKVLQEGASKKTKS